MLMEVEQDKPLLKWLPSKEHSEERGEKSNLMVEKSDKHDLSQVTKVNINSDKSHW